MESEHVKTLDGFRVVAVRGEGVFVADSDGRCWHVGGPNPGSQQDNALAQAYRSAFSEESV
jgi:hypothetical protein